jgi:hypothetical protein
MYTESQYFNHLNDIIQFLDYSKAQLNGTLTSTGAGEKKLQAVLQSGGKSHNVHGSVKVTPQVPIMVICNSQLSFM